MPTPGRGRGVGGRGRLETNLEPEESSQQSPQSVSSQKQYKQEDKAMILFSLKLVNKFDFSDLRIHLP